MKTRACDLCNGNAVVYCTSDTAYLCWGCDSKVHAANFLVARHVRLPICSECSGIIGDGIDGADSESMCSCSHSSEGQAMPKQVEISSSSDGDVDVEECNQKNAGFTAKELTSQDWLLRKAEVYQEYMNVIPVPTLRGSIIPFTSWIGLGRSMKQLYGQPLHYLTNISLKRWDQSRIGDKDEHIPLDTIINPCKAEASIWLMEEVHRLTTSPHYLAKLWQCDTMFHSFIDPIFPHLRSWKQRNQNRRTRQE